MTDLAPIGISTYIRLNHLRQTISTLQKNELARQSKLYVFSDGPKPGDEERVARVRSYLGTVDGFREVHVIKRKRNGRTANNRRGMRLLLERFGKVIFLEEDVITAPGFLSFMNQALEKYRDEPKIFSISGYSPPIKIPANYRHDVFFLRRFNAWGFGTWKNRFDQVRYISPAEYEQFAADNKKVQRFVSGGGADMMVMLKADAYGEIDAGDVKAMYAQFLGNQYTVYPVRSLANNIGHDGTGEHCVKTDMYEVELGDKTAFTFPDKVRVDNRIVRANFRFRSGQTRLALRLRSGVGRLLGARNKQKIKSVLSWLSKESNG